MFLSAKFIANSQVRIFILFKIEKEKGKNQFFVRELSYYLRRKHDFFVSCVDRENCNDLFTFAANFGVIVRMFVINICDWNEKIYSIPGNNCLSIVN